MSFEKDPHYRPSDLLNTAIESLTAAGIAQARLDAEVMLAAATGMRREIVLIMQAEIDAAARARFDAMVTRRVAREPLAYIIGRREFYSLELEVTPDVLIPRPESELIVDVALDYLAANRAARVLDIGTGSGAIAIAIAANAPQLSVVAVDISAPALSVAGRNVARYHLEGRICLKPADCFNAVEGSLGEFDLVVSNPPYIAASELPELQPEILKYEPRLALEAGPDGLNLYRRIAHDLAQHLRIGGCAVFEHGAGQAEAVSKIFRTHGFSDLQVRHDLAGKPRLLRIVR